MRVAPGVAVVEVLRERRGRVEAGLWEKGGFSLQKTVLVSWQCRGQVRQSGKEERWDMHDHEESNCMSSIVFRSSP